MNNKMIDGVRAALDEMAVAKSMVQHELEAAQEAARNASAEAHAEGYYKDKEIKKQDKKLGNTKEEMDPTDHVKEKDGKFCVYNADGSIAKEFDNKKDADEYAIANHDKLMATAKKDEAVDPVNPDAAKKKFADRKDKDIDNDGDVDSSDKFLHKRRKAIGKTMAKEGTVRERLMSIWEDAAGAKRTAGATEAEPMTKGDEDKKMKAGHPVAKAALSDNSDAAEKATKPAAMRGNDNKQAEKAIKPSATPDHPANKSTKEQFDALKDAYAMVESMDKIMTVDIDHATMKTGSHERKMGIKIKKNKNGFHAVDATGKKGDLQKYLIKHYGDKRDAMELHPEIFKK
jgi:hypothetical protein